MTISIINKDCFKFFDETKEKDINLVLVDLPYGQTACHWDILIDLDKMWEELRKVCAVNCAYVFFCTTKFGVSLINSNPTGFRYDLVWEKSNTVGFLCAKKAPLRKHEMIYVFSNPYEDDVERKLNIKMRKYAECVFKYIDKPYKTIFKKCGNYKNSHFLSFSSQQFGYPKKEAYQQLIDLYKIDEMGGFIKYEDFPKFESPAIEYNPQMAKGKPYKSSPGRACSVYGSQKKIRIINTGTRYPHSILKFNNPKKSLHPTQKPVELCEWVIKTYSNKNDKVLDFTMGSGTTGVACLNTGRNFIGVEKDKKIFDTAKKRLDDYLESIINPCLCGFLLK